VPGTPAYGASTDQEKWALLRERDAQLDLRLSAGFDLHAFVHAQHHTFDSDS
jgi:hypothetical protein